MELMITKKDFVEKINFIKKERDTQRNISKILSPIMEGFFTYIDFYEENLIETLEMLTYSKDELVGWWVYENDFGAKKLSLYIGKTQYTPITVEDLYDILILIFKNRI